MTNFTILDQTSLDAKLLKALLMLLCLKGIAKGLAISSMLAICLSLYTLVADALVEITSNIAQLWGQSDSIIKLLMLVLAVYIIHRLFPCIAYLHKRGIL